MGFLRLDYLTVIYGLLLLTVGLMTVFEDQLFTKNNAKELIEDQEILLADKFDFEENKSMFGIGDSYHTFTLKISGKDKLKAIEQIKTANNFKRIGKPTIDFLYGTIDKYNGPKQTQNYETENRYVREHFEPSGQGYAPTFRRISIDKKGNKSTFEDIDE